MQIKKSLGQHFLHSEQIIKNIVDTANVSANDTILEIGPGEGDMTEILSNFAGKLIAIEKDHRLIPILEEKFKAKIKSGNIILVEGDILEFDIKKLILNNKKYKIVANIPYYITGQIIRIFLESKEQPESMTLLVQKEVAERIVARDKKESLLSISVKIFGTPIYIKTVGRGAFTPHPNVDSAIIHIKDISKLKLHGLDEKFFFKIIHAGFAHKRKQLLPNLTDLYERKLLIKIFEECKIDQKSRSEDVSLNKWLELCNLLQTIVE